MKTVCLTPSANWYSGGALASDGDRLLVGCARQALLLAGPAPATGPAPPSLQCHGVIENAHRERATGALVWRSSSDSVSVVSCGEDGSIKLWKCDFTDEGNKFQSRCEKQHNAHGKHKVAALAHASRSPHVAISVDERGTFVIWDTVAHTTRTLFLERMAPTELRCSPHTEHVVAVAGKRGLLWTVSLAASGRVLQKLRGHDDDVTSISWCPELTTLLSFEQDHLLVSASKDRTLRVWGTRGGRCHVTQRVPAAEGGGRRQGGGGGERAWLAVLWTQPDCLYSSGLSGQLLRWRLTADKDNYQVVHRSHGRSLFNIVRLGDLVVSSGIERQMVVHDPRSLLTAAVPCLGGQVAALDVCPVDPGRLAIGCGDQTIRVWNLGADTPYSTVSIWQGIKAKVLTVAWHPQKDTRLAFGTDEGRVGVCDPSSSSRPPQLCPEHHSGPVYTVCWSPSGQLYSLSLGAVWRHDPARMTIASWPPAAGRAPCSQLSWGGGGAAIGRQDGAVELVTADGVVRGTALGHRRLVTALKWCPHQAEDGRTTLAVGSYDTFISVFDVPNLDGSGCPELLQARVTLTGHRSKVLDLAWLTDSPSQLVSASQDATVRVWDTVTGSVLSIYPGHHRPVHCCLPHPLLPGRVFSGGDDCSLHLWRVDKQDSSLPENVSSGTAVTAPRTRAGPAGVTVPAANGSDGGEDKAPAAATAVVQPRELGDSRKTRTQRSLFPLTLAAENRGKSHSQADMEHLMAAGDSSAPGEGDWKHLGLFGGGSALREMIDMEMRHHESQRSSGQLLHMSLWRGDPAAVVRAAADEALLTDELLSLAPMVSYRFWEEMSVKYAKQLENAKECLKASSVLLACHKVTEAVSLLVRHGLYREALCVSRLRLPPGDPGHGQILRRWADQLTADGNMEQAAKCYLSLGDGAAAAGALSRRSDPASLRLAARLWARAGDPIQARALALICLHTSCMRAEWEAGLAVARDLPAVAAGVHLCIAHRLLTTELEAVRDQLFPWAVGLLRKEKKFAMMKDAIVEALMDEKVREAFKAMVTKVVEEAVEKAMEPKTEMTEAVTGEEGDAESPEEGETSIESPSERSENETESPPGQGSGSRSPTEEEAGPETQNGHHDGTRESPAAEQREETEMAASGKQEGGGADTLLDRIRQAWRTAEAEIDEGLQQGLQEVAYRTMPTTPKQLWLAVCSELCLAALESEPAAATDRLVNTLALCQQNVPAQLPLLCALLVPSPTGGVWEKGRRYVLSAVLSVLHRRSLLPDDPHSVAASASSDGAEAALSAGGGEQSQFAPPPSDGSSGVDSGREPSASGEGSVTNDGIEGNATNGGVVAAQSDKKETSGEGDAGVPSDVDLVECVRLLKSLYVSEKTEEEEERMFSELEDRLKAV